MKKKKFNFKNYFKNLLPTIKKHFKLANQGKENLNIAIWVWGGAAYVVSFFLNKLIIFINLEAISWIISILALIYFAWHIIIIRRCSPKKKKLTKKRERTTQKRPLKKNDEKITIERSFCCLEQKHYNNSN